MAYYKFAPEDIINTEITAFPKTNYVSGSGVITGSIMLEKKFLNNAISSRRYQGYSERLGGFVEKNGPFSSSIDMMQATEDGTNKEMYATIANLYRYYSFYSSDYMTYNSASDTSFRVINIPEIYFDRTILTGSFTGSDVSGTTRRTFYDNGRGGLHSGSLTGTLIGHIFYNEGLAVLKASNLSTSFGSGTVSFSFRGVQRIPVKIIRCRAPAGELNCSTNSTYFRIRTDLSASNRNEKEIMMANNTTYITKVGIYNDDYELVAVASLAHPIRKDEERDIQIRLKWDW